MPCQVCVLSTLVSEADTIHTCDQEELGSHLGDFHAAARGEGDEPHAEAKITRGHSESVVAQRWAARPSTITFSMNSKRSFSSGETRVSGPASSTRFGNRSDGSDSR